MLQSGTNQIGHADASDLYDSYGKVEKLQIEGTVRNLDESGLDRDRAKFNKYWAGINWGPRNSWTEESKRDKWNRYEHKEPLYTDNDAEGYQKRPRYSTDMLQDPEEVELIDSSKVSDELANLRFMRLEKRLKKDI